MIRAKYVLVLLTVIFIGGFAASTSDASPLKRQQQQQKIFGVMDDRPVAALAAQAGFNVIKKTVLFTPTQWHWNALNADYRDQLTTDMAAAQAAHISVILEMYPVPKYGPPLGATQQSNTCMLAKDLLDQFPETYGIEIGVEPNNYTFWRPQFKPDGTQASAAAYEQWLAKCYDVVKAGHPDVMVIGGSLSSRGDDDPHKPKSGTSPTAFLQKFCEAYKASGRDRPVMDVIDVHNYPDPEDQDPAVQHPYPSTTITIADAGKLEELLNCFNGTAQPKPPYIWGESGYNTEVPKAQEKGRYTGTKPASIRSVDEATQGRYVAEQIAMADCQPNSLGLINLHLVDDPSLSTSWQSGFAYAPSRQQRSADTASVNYTFKQSWPIVRKALVSALSGTIKCG